MRTVADIFKAFSGPAGLGRAAGVTTEHATTMRRRGSIPVAYWPALVEFAEAHAIEGVTYAVLVAIHAPSDMKAAV